MAKSDLLDREKVKALRLAAKMTQEQAAERAGLKGGKGQWSTFESGNAGGITLDTLGKIAAALGCEPADLLRSSKRG